MRKHKRGRKLSRKTGQRKALLKSLGTALILNEKVSTTEAKAKELRPFIEKIITKSKEKDRLHSRKILAKYFSNNVSKKIMTELGERYKERKGGYTRIIKLGPRKGDSARMAIIELIK